MTYKLKGLALAAGLALAGGTAQAASFSFTGSFTGDADVALISFTLGTTSTVTLRSYSYAGGTMADGTVIAAGGFDPILSLWTSRGYMIDEADDGPRPVPEDPVSWGPYDVHLSVTLQAGTYVAALSQYENRALGFNISEGFSESSPTFTAEFGCSNGQFCDYDGYNRTSAWAFDVLGVDSATVVSAVPLPASAPLLLAGLAALGLRRRRR